MMKQKPQLCTKTLILSIIGVIVFGGIGYNLKDRIFGAPLVVSTAADGTTLDTPFLPVTGTARHAREIAINGRSVSVDRQGNFTDEVVLSPGYNIVEVAAKDQFGNEKRKTYQIVVTPGQNLASTISVHNNL